MSDGITIDNLDADTLARLKAEAARRGIGVNIAASQLLKECFESAPKSKPTRALEELAGTWTRDEADAFLSAVAD